MAENNYSMSSLVSLKSANLTNIVGTVKKNSNNTIDVGSKSSFDIVLNYNTTNNIIRTSGIQLNYNISSSNIELETRYNTNITLSIIIEYYKETVDESEEARGFSDGIHQFINTYPHLQHEDNRYNNTLEIKVRDNLFKKVTFRLSNNTESDIRLNSLAVPYIMTVSETVSEVTNTNISIKRIEFVSDFSVILTNRNNAIATLDITTDADGNPNGISVNKGKLIVGLKI